MTSYQHSHPGMYGSNTVYGDIVQGTKDKPPFVKGERQSLNSFAIALSMFLPWFIFCAMYWVVSFWVHYKNPFLCQLFVDLCFIVVAITGYYAVKAIKKRKDAQREPTWAIFLFATCFLAWLLGGIAGEVNFTLNMSPYYDVWNLNTYENVEPSRNRGGQLLDAGTVTFAQDSSIDLSRAMGFMNLDVYCVAPIVNGKDTKHMHSYDFWAVGMNCCSGLPSHKADYHCGQFNNAFARSGLRLMHDDQRAFYRMAVQQAEAAYNIRANHPLFFYWVQEPETEVNAYWDKGIQNFFVCIFSHFIFQFFLVSVCCIAFSKLGRLL